MPSAALIRERLRQILAQRGLTAVELAREADVKTSFLYDILNGKSTNPSTLTLGRVAKTLGVSLAYLSGMDHPAPNAPEDSAEYASIPLIEEAAVSAGAGAQPASEKVSGYYHFRRSWIRNRLQTTPEHLRMVYIRGDSMSPTLHDGDIILVDTSRNVPSPPGIFVLDDGIGIVAKRLELVGDAPARIRIISDNPQYGAYERELRDTRIIGRVIWFAREV